MNDPARMRRIQRIRDLRAEIQQRICRKRPPSDSFPQRLPLEQFHHEKRSAVVRAYIVNCADSGMV